jgi:GNAT superfamily N-acetyltransferase
LAVAYKPNEPIGMLLARADVPETNLWLMRDDYALWVRDTLESNGRLGIIDDLVVAPAHRQLGVARHLLISVMDRLRAFGVTHVVTVVSDKLEPHVAQWLNRLGFRTVYQTKSGQLFARDANLFLLRLVSDA